MNPRNSEKSVRCAENTLKSGSHQQTSGPVTASVPLGPCSILDAVSAISSGKLSQYTSTQPTKSSEKFTDPLEKQFRKPQLHLSDSIFFRLSDYLRGFNIFESNIIHPCFGMFHLHAPCLVMSGPGVSREVVLSLTRSQPLMMRGSWDGSPGTLGLILADWAGRSGRGEGSSDRKTTKKSLENSRVIEQLQEKVSDTSYSGERSQVILSDDCCFATICEKQDGTCSDFITYRGWAMNPVHLGSQSWASAAS